MRVYFGKWAGAGTDSDPFRLTIYDNLPHDKHPMIDSYDLRVNPEVPEGWGISWARNLSEDDHLLILRDPMSIHIPRDSVPAEIPQKMRDVTDLNRLAKSLNDRKIQSNGIGIDTATLTALLAVFPDMA